MIGKNNDWEFGGYGFISVIEIKFNPVCATKANTKAVIDLSNAWSFFNTVFQLKFLISSLNMYVMKINVAGEQNN